MQPRSELTHEEAGMEMQEQTPRQDPLSHAGPREPERLNAAGFGCLFLLVVIIGLVLWGVITVGQWVWHSGDEPPFVRNDTLCQGIVQSAPDLRTAPSDPNFAPDFARSYGAWKRAGC